MLADPTASIQDPALLEAICRRSGIRFHASLVRPLGRWIESRLRVVGLASVADYFSWLGNPAHLEAERPALSNVTSSRETFFLRDHGQIALLRQQILPELIARNSATRTLRLWSVGCSTGEEPYTLAMLARETGLLSSDWRLEVTGFDIDPESLHVAARGVYRDWSFRGCPDTFRDQYFQKSREGWRIDERLRQAVQFRSLDLLAQTTDPVVPEMADLILCRNVFIYLDHPAIDQALNWLLRHLSEGGYLFCAPGELASHPRPELAVCAFPEAVVYRKVVAGSTTAMSITQRASLATPIGPLTPVVPPNKPDVRPRLSVFAAVRAHETLPVHAAEPHEDWLTKAWDAANRGKLDDAANQCAHIRERNPFDPEAYYLSAILALAGGSVDAARDELRRVLYLAPDYLPAYPMLAELCLTESDLVAAERYARQGLDRVRQRVMADRVSPYSTNTVGDIQAHLEQLMANLTDIGLATT